MINLNDLGVQEMNITEMKEENGGIIPVTPGINFILLLLSLVG